MTWERRLDAILLHRVASPVLSVLLALAAFESLFALLQPLAGACRWSAGAILGLFPAGAGLGRLLLTDAIQTAAAILPFLVQLVLLQILIAVLRDCGYLSRVSLVANGLLSRLGLHGSSVGPLVCAHACAVPGIMAARRMENRRERIVTIFVLPFFSCSARLAVYTFLIQAFVPDVRVLGSWLGLRALVLLAIYGVGLCGAAVTARLLKSTVLPPVACRACHIQLVPYGWPRLRTMAAELRDAGQAMGQRLVVALLVITIAVSVLSHLPARGSAPPRLEASYIGMLGRWIEPVVRPLGCDKRDAVALLISIAGREAFIAALCTLYGAPPAEASHGTVFHRRGDAASGIALLVLFALGMQCASTVAIVWKELGARWCIAQFAYMNLLAYAAAWTAYQAMRL